MGMSDEILVVKREKLFGSEFFEGFVSKDIFDYHSKIGQFKEYVVRSEALENNPEYQQVIPYVWIVNSREKKVFAYRRANKKENYNERRLMNKWSCGVGGHIDKDELDGDAVLNSMMRELKEEVKMDEYPTPKIVGYINDDSDSVGKVHFGVVAIAETLYEVKKGDDEMVEGNFYSVDELDRIFSSENNEIETWTRISWPFVKDYLNKL